MTPQRWARIEEIFGEALEKPVGDRTAFLAAIDDEQLRRDVEQLLAEEQKPSFRSPLGSPELAPGEMLGRYRVEAKLGQGGMGAVYKAYDTVLRRPVALKILLAWRLTGAEDRLRLAREARAASALNHPNIVTIHDIGCERGVDFIAMEYVPGKPLESIIARKGLPRQDIFRYGLQIADALAAAHAVGIVHRDIKPDNILVTDAGVAKILDFGLARLVSGSPPGPDATSTVRQPTEEGVVFGTPSYMSPEQAAGKTVDARSDIFSFGSVLYQMVTGRRAFPGNQHVSALTAILHQEPTPVAEIVPTVPAELNRLVVRCLRKDPARRFQHMEDVKATLEDMRQELASSTTIAAQPSHAARWKALLLAGVAIVALFAALFVGWRATLSSPDRRLVLTQVTTDTGLTYQPAISPNGDLIAYASDRSGEDKLDIWVQHLPRGEPIRLTHEKGNHYEPSFSPNGAEIAFVSDREQAGLRGGGIYLVPSLGGVARKIADMGRRPRFSPDGKWIAYWAGNPNSGGATYIVSVAGDRPRHIAPELGTRSPVWTPDGKHLLVRGYDNSADWWIAGVEGGKPVRTGVLEACARANLQSPDSPQANIRPDEWIPGTNEVLFSARLGDSINLWKIALSPTTWKAQGEPRRLTVGPGPDLQASVAPGGRVIFSNATPSLDIWSLPVDPNRGTALGHPQQLTHGTGHDHSPSISRDGRRMVFESDRTGKPLVWTKDLQTGKETMLTVTPSWTNMPKLSPDGMEVAYSVVRGSGNWDHYTVPFSGGTPRKTVDKAFPIEWTADRQSILRNRGNPAHLELFNLQTGEKTIVAQHQTKAIWSGFIAPGGNWISFGTLGRDQIGERFIAPLRNGTTPPESQWIPTRGSIWSPDGNRMWGVSGEDGFQCIWTQRLDPQTKRMIGELEPVYHFHSSRRSLANAGNQSQPGLSVAGDKVVFALGELTGNIWMVEPERR